MSDEKTVVNLAVKQRDAGLWTVEQMLEDALKDVRENPDKYPQAVILYVNNDDKKYATCFSQAGMTMSQIIALMEVQKMNFLSEMGYIVQDVVNSYD